MEGDEEDGPTGRKICKACLTTQPDGEFCVRCGGELMEIRPTEDPYLGHVVGGKYKLVEKIGQGGMGVVYKGVNEKLGQRVAVKFLSRKLADDESIVKRFLNEARSYCRVVHPNAVTLLDYGQHHDSTLYIITEFIDGKSLTDTLKAVGPLAPEEAIHIGLQVCEVLSAAHLEGVIHRDLKPDNLMLISSSRGRYAVKVLDFGIAKIVDEEGGPNTETGSVFGTPEFMSPEQARGDSADPRSDLYALGIILFYMLTGKLPFKGKNKLVVLNKQLNADPPRPSEVRKGIEVPARLEAVIAKLLNKNPEGRYESADDLAEALEELQVPGGMDTAKVGVKVSREESSPEIRLNTLRFGLAEDTEGSEEGIDRAGDADPLGDTVAQFGEREFDDSVGPPPDLESIEMWREHPTHQTDMGDPESKRFAMMAGGSVLLLLVVAIAAIAFSGGESKPTQVDGMESVLATGQVLGMLAAAEEMVAEGSIDEAARSLEATEMWLADEELPERGVERRRQLRRELGKLRTWRAQIEGALDEGSCSEAEKVLETIRSTSPGLWERLSERVQECKSKKPGTAGGTPSEKPEVAPTAEPEPADPESADPESADPESADPESADPESAAPESADPEAADPESATTAPDSDAQDPALPPEEVSDESVDPSPGVDDVLEEFEAEQGGTDDSEPSADDEKNPAEPMPDGMALPPRKVNEDAG